MGAADRQELAARLDLVRTLRELGLGVPATGELLAQRRSVREVATEHVRALDGEIRLLELRRHVATVGSTTEEMRIVHDLATLFARERQQTIDDFVARVFDDVPDDAPGAGIARGMRVRDMAVTGAAATPEDPDAMAADMGGCRRSGGRRWPTASCRGLPRPSGWVTDPDRRTALADRLAVFTDALVERYWHLLGVLNGRPPSEPAVPAVEWWIGALRAGPG